MFGLLKRQNPCAQDAKFVYGRVLEHTCEPVFYEGFRVPDSFDGRFDVLLVHIFVILEAADHEEFNQALFDVTFADMDQTLREMGIGDMGIPKHMRKMMKAFNGRMHAYQDALETDDLKEALRRNLYGTLDEVDGEQVSRFETYIKNNIKALKKCSFGDLVVRDPLFDMKAAS